MTLGGFDHDGRLYIVEMKLGRFNPEEVIEHIFDWHKRYPKIVDFKIEKDAHARVLMPFLQRETSKRQLYPRVIAIPRDTHTSKKHRIRGLRPWFKKGIILFSQAIPLAVKTELLDEVAQFPSESTGVHDDALDTLADLMQDADSDTGITSDVIADSPVDVHSQFGRPRPPDRFLGFDEWGEPQFVYGPDAPTRERKMTGIL
jgi:predicted phage terminase large subunit-like protein